MLRASSVRLAAQSSPATGSRRCRRREGRRAWTFLAVAAAVIAVALAAGQYLDTDRHKVQLRAERGVEVHVVLRPRPHEVVGALRVAPSFVGAPRRVQVLREPRTELRRAEERPQPVVAESVALEELPGHVVVVPERVEHEFLVASS